MDTGLVLMTEDTTILSRPGTNPLPSFTHRYRSLIDPIVRHRGPSAWYNITMQYTYDRIIDFLITISHYSIMIFIGSLRCIRLNSYFTLLWISCRYVANIPHLRNVTKSSRS